MGSPSFHYLERWSRWGPFKIHRIYVNGRRKWFKTRVRISA